MPESLKPENKTFEVEFEAAGVSVGKMRNEVTVSAIEPFQTVNMMATDEGEFHGGENTAPTPLEYFAVGLVGCLMTQLRVFSKKMKIPVENVAVKARLRWAGGKAANEASGQPYVTAPIGFDLDIDFDSEADQKDLARLVDAAQSGCFVEQTLAQSNKVGHRFRNKGGDWVEA